VVTAILGLVIGVIAASLGGGIRTWDTARRFGRIEAQAAIALDVLERDLANAFHFHDVPFQGSTGTAAFPGRVEAGEAGGEPFWQIGTIRYRFDPEREALLRLAWTYPSSEPPAGRSELLLSDVKNLAFSYRAGNGGSGTAAWDDSWNSATNFPIAVRLELTFPAEEVGTLTRTMRLPVAP